MLQKFKKLKRYIITIGGTGGVAVANFMLASVLLITGSPEVFGTFAFIQVIVAFGYALSNATLGSPLMYFVNRTDHVDDLLKYSYFQFSFIFSVVFSLISALIIYFLSLAVDVAIAVFFSTLFLVLRWFGRSYNYTLHRHENVALSDIAYSVVALLGALALYLTNHVTLYHIVLLQLVSGFVSFFVLGLEVLTSQIKSLFLGQISTFVDGFKEKGKHSLLGVLTTQATTNGHSYIIVLLFGPQFFAPIAAGLLFFRPVPLIISSLTQLERPKIAKYLKCQDVAKALSVVKSFRLLVLVAWVFNVSVAAVLVIFYADFITRDTYQYADIAIAVAFWAFITGFRCFRGPESALLQANGDFKPLSLVTLKSALVTLPLVVLFAYAVGPLWSLIGVLVGEVMASLLTIRLATQNIPQNRMKVSHE